MSILLRQLEKEAAPRYGSMERPSTWSAEGKATPAIAQVVGIKSVWFTSSLLIVRPLAPSVL